MRSSLTRRQFLEAVAAFGLAATGVGCGRDVQPINLAASLWLGYEPLFLAKRQGWLDPRLARLSELPSNASTLRALAAGVVQGAALTLDEVLRSRAGGMPLRIVLVFDFSAGADMLLAKPEIDSLAKLKGRRIGIDQSTNGALLLSEALQRVGMSATDLIQVPLNFADQTSAWRENRVDAVITYDPAASEFLAAGARRLFDSKQFPERIVDVLAVHADALNEDNAAAIRHIIAAYFQGLDFLKQQPAEAASLMADHLGMPPDRVLPAYQGLVLTDAAHNQRLLRGNAPTLLASARDLAEFMHRSGLLAHANNLQDLIASEYLPEESAA